MTTEAVILERGITEVLHFTTNQGLLGILYSGFLKSRNRLEKDEQLEFIFSPNAAFRKDKEWLDHVNLSIGRINSQFFKSAGYWHRDRKIWWCILSFDPVILTHEGVTFSTTNNIYTGVMRGNGGEFLAKLFAGKIVRWNGNIVTRSPQLPSAFPTCEQAEVLYPGQVSLEYLKKIYVISDDDQDEVCGQFRALNHPEIEVVVSPQIFGIEAG